MTRIAQINDSKSAIRKIIRERLSRLSRSDYVANAQSLCSYMVATPWFRQARSIALYYPISEEIDTRPFINTSWRAKKALYLPVILSNKTKTMSFARYSPSTRLAENAYQLLAPQTNGRLTCSIAELDIVIVPMVAFDSQYHRLGKGEGYYDRLLANCNASTRFIGVAHSLQQIDTVPVAPHDISMHSIITEKGVLKGRTERNNISTRSRP